MRRRRRAPRGPRTGFERAVTLVLLVVAVAAGVVALAGGDGRSGDEQAQVAVRTPAPRVGPRLVQVRGQGGCIKGTASPRWTRCRVGSRALKDARSVAISADGRFAYAASVEASSVAAFARDPGTGALRALRGRGGCVADAGASGARGCVRVRGLRGALTVTLSPDGRHAYVAAIDANAVVGFSRDGRTGALRRVGCVADRATPVPGCAPAPGLAGARWVTVSPDGRSVYVASPASDAIAVLRRDPDSGRIHPLERAPCVRDVRALAPCPVAVPGLDEPRMVTVSPDGRNVYAVGELSYTVVALRRERDTGALTPVPGAECVEDVRAPAAVDCPVSAAGLNYAFFVTVSPDGRHAYTTATASDAIAAFDRDPSSGALRPLAGRLACLADAHTAIPGCPRRARGLNGAASLRFARDGRHAYVASFYGGALAVLERDRRTGVLRTLGGRGACVADPQAPSTPKTTRCPSRARGVEGPRDVVLSPDGVHAYVPSSVGGSIAVFRRRR